MSNPKLKYPCGECGQNCVSTNCLFCVECRNWVHSSCQDISNDELKEWTDCSEDFICNKCASYEGNFDYCRGLQRLSKASEESFSKLKAVAKRESLISRETNIISEIRGTPNIDNISTDLMKTYTFEHSTKAAVTSGDGNCLFNATSIALSGNEALAEELRFKTCIEMCLSPDLMKNQKKYNDFLLLSPTCEEATIACSTDRAWSSIWTIISFYAKLKNDENYKKRVTFFIHSPKNDNLNSLAIVEYCGIKTVFSAHGNSKQSIPYERTKPEILQKASELANQQNPKDVYAKMVGDDSLNAPKSFKQIRQKKYRDKQKSGSTCSANLADEVLGVINMINTSDHVQRVILAKGDKPPCVIMYSENQMEDLRSNITVSERCVLGVDRTFNLGASFVTCMVYKNRQVYSRETGESPIFLGPMFLHWDATFKTYDTYFSHVKTKLYDCLKNIEVKLGSDQGKAIVKALKSSFPTAELLLCTKHLKDNVTSYLKDEVGCCTADRNIILDKCFGPKGLAECDDTFNFETQIATFDDMLEKYPKFKSYFQNQIKGLVWNHICVPAQNGTTTSLWTNNNCESINNVLKQATNWKPQKLPDLVTKLAGVTELQMLDLRRALYGPGNYVLTPRSKKYLVSRDVWIQKSKKQRDELFLNFLKQVKTEDKKSIHATNANFVIPNVPRLARKPGQRKRGKAERATK